MLRPTLLLALCAVALAGCNSKVDPQLQADQMTLSDATCAEAEVATLTSQSGRSRLQHLVCLIPRE